MEDSIRLKTESAHLPCLDSVGLGPPTVMVMTSAETKAVVGLNDHRTGLGGCVTRTAMSALSGRLATREGSHVWPVVVKLHSMGRREIG